MLGLALLAVACNQAPQSGSTVPGEGERASAEQPRSPPTRGEEVRIARWKEGGPAMLADGGGDLAIYRGCLVVGHIAKRRFVLPVFPYGEGTWDPVTRKFLWMGTQYALGDPIELMGGSISAKNLKGVPSEIPDCGDLGLFLVYSGKHFAKEYEEGRRAASEAKDKADAQRP